MTISPLVLFLFGSFIHSTVPARSQTIPTIPHAVDPECAKAATNLDIIFLVDTSCSLTTDECTTFQHGIANLIATIKKGSEPRVGYIEFADYQHVDVTLDDPFWNNESTADDATIRQEYTQYISNIPRHTATLQTDTLSAIKFAQSHFKDSATGTLIHKSMYVAIWMAFNNKICSKTS